MSMGWLLTNTYPPWLSAWLETAALSSSLLFCIAAWKLAKSQTGIAPVTLSFPLAVLASLVLLSLGIQIPTGVILFTGDAVMVFAYLLAWLLAVYAGHVAARADAQNVDIFWIAVLGSAIFSVGLALVQWLGVEGLNIFILDMRAGGRPFANLGQPNNFSTLCFLGCAGLLYLHERGEVRGAPFWLAWCWLSFGMALSQSRTGWVQMACLTVGLWWLCRRVPMCIRPRSLIGLGAVFVAWVAALPLLADGLLTSTGRSLGQQMQGGVRAKYWLSMLHAITERPWMGYGWLQTGLAEQLQSSSRINEGIHDFAHNIALDVILWAGLPIGLTIVFCFFCWLLSSARRVNEAASAMILMAIMGFLIHASLEYPLAYAYFLVPFGFLMGAFHGLCSPGVGWAIGRRPMAVLLSATASLFMVIGHDYFLAEAATRDLRFESARIGPQAKAVEVPDMLLLTQLQALMRYGYRDPHEGISKEAWMQTGLVSARYGLAFVMFRYALASAFRGEPAVAQETLNRICRIHTLSKCQYARLEWKLWGERYPLSVGRIEFPESLHSPRLSEPP